MNADHEPSRLPLRAGAMMLLAVAIVFLGLGWHSAATSGDDPERELQDAQSQVATSTTQSAASTTASASADTPQLCVFNAGSISGLAADVTESLQAAGFQTDEPGNLSTASITENTIFYDDDQQSAAQEVADALGGDASLDPRPSSFTQCPDGIPVIVVTR
ncbi:LytR family transcriptional regulator [Gordonia sp. HNM0687]|uniref:LytR family transcriptional regulator n=1 Tax=Gordonia mangrovi TaxID=2665643 RepID=A0A6L7GYH9_9ACTN|nr:LytR C-terminal domain-containing protein [Gordonia mangrovi]MDY6809228.1 LytR C-terminal domain-containing protein [Actinomycetota bacterium]MXP23818.1 LytR family transcriptional regulator [Gordonia mangrovi]UVF76377.1 LytR C-terminal domain-containing protein [Gordonia mangrovi]